MFNRGTRVTCFVNFRRAKWTPLPESRELAMATLDSNDTLGLKEKYNSATLAVLQNNYANFHDWGFWGQRNL